MSLEENTVQYTLLVQISSSQADSSSSDSKDERAGSSQAQEARPRAAHSSRRAGTEGAGSKRRKRKSASLASASTASKSAHAAIDDDSQLTRAGTEFIHSLLYQVSCKTTPIENYHKDSCISRTPNIQAYFGKKELQKALV